MAVGSTNGQVTTDWRSRLGGRLVSPEEAVGHVRSGDKVSVAVAQSTPFVLCAALAARLGELEDVTVQHTGALADWDLPGVGERFRLETYYISPFDRAIYTRGDGDFMPISYFRAEHLPAPLEDVSVYMMRVSPPNAEGYVSLGDCQIMSKLTARNARLVLGEIDERTVWTGGDNAMHLSEIDYFIERPVPIPDIVMPPPPPEEAAIADTICQLVAGEIIHDRATVQVGVGATSGRLMDHLQGHSDLGMQTEVVPLGVANLVRAGVITGKYKKIFPGLVVGSAFAVGTSREELDFIDGNPAFHLYDFNFTDDIRLIAREEGLIAVNNALAVDLTGQVNSESMGPQIYSGTGGQTAFAVGASLSGGRSVIVTPATALRQGKPISRIVACLAEGSAVTVPRAFVDYVVTEYGIAKLRGKSLRQRWREITAIAHPDFRAELNAAGKRFWG